MIYGDWGFSHSPFESTPLPPTELGRKLLVGRDREVGILERRIQNGPKMPTVEGLNGVGKTSVVNVAAYSLYKRHITDGSCPLYLPCRKIFQLKPQIELDEFVLDVLTEVAQTLVERASDLTKTTKKVDTAPLDRWLNSPQLKSFTGGIPWVQFGITQSNNEASGFSKSGVKKTVTSWLEDIFADGGGVVCMIDNLELLQQSAIVRNLVEQLRDELLTIKGLRWVLCGALGIVYGFASSPRLEGYLHTPVDLKEVNDSNAPLIFSSRVEAYKERNDAYLPLTSSDFTTLYEILRGNLRAALSYSDDYCEWAADRELPQTDVEKSEGFKHWLNAKASEAHTVAIKELSPRALRVFTDAASLGGIFAPGDFETLGFNTMQVLRPKIVELERIGLLVSTQDDSDKRRKTIQITPKGWLVDFKLSSD